MVQIILNRLDDERRAVVESDAEFHMGITPYYAALMDPDDPSCPIRQQSVPTMGELTIAPADLEDPLAEERDMPVPGITHRYPDRVLFYTTHNCPVYCRHCTRKRKVSDPTSAAARQPPSRPVWVSLPCRAGRRGQTASAAPQRTTRCSALAATIRSQDAEGTTR